MATTTSKIWTKLLGTSNLDQAAALTTGLDGSIYISGYTSGSLDGQANSGNIDTFLTKYSPDGTKVWTKLLGTSARDFAAALTTGLDGSIYVGGSTGSALDGQTFSGGESDTFLTKYSPDGTKVWTKLLGTSGIDQAAALTTGLDGSIYISGYTYGSLDGQANSSSSYDAYLTKYSPDGTKVWTKLLGTRTEAMASALTTGLDGSIYVGGHTSSALDGQVFYGGNNDTFLTKYSPDGTKVWTKLLGTSGIDQAAALTTGLDGSIYISGYTSGSLDGQASSGSYDAYLTKYSPDGTKVWTKLLGTSDNDYGYALTTGLDGSIYISGLALGSLDGQSYSGNGDMFLTKYSPDGTKVWTKLLGTFATDFAFALTTGLDGSIYAGGLTGSALDGQANNGDYDAFLVKYQESTATPTYSLSAADASANEGSTATFTLTTTNVAAGTSVPYTLSGISAADISGGALTGNAVVNSSGLATISVALLNDSLTEGTETLTVTAGGATASTLIYDLVDISPPKITSIYFSSNELGLRTTGTGYWTDKINFAVTATDDISGVAKIYLDYFYTVGSKGYAFSIRVSGTGVMIEPVSGTPNAGTWNFSNTYNGTGNIKYPGTYALKGIYVEDKAGNAVSYDATNFLSLGLNSPETYNLTVVDDRLVASTQTIDEGSSAVFNFVSVTSDLANGTSVSYTISGVSASDIVGEKLTGTTIINNSAATIYIPIKADLLTEGVETLTLSIDGATASIKINDTSQSSVTYSLSSSSTTVNEGSTATFTLTTTNVASGTSVPYSLSGISAADVSGGSLSGNAVVNSSGVATISVTLLNDSLTEGSETLTVTAGGANASTIIIDTSQSLPTYSLSSSSTSADEGSTANFTVTTSNVAAGSSIAFTLSGVSSSDITGGALTGYAVVNSAGIATVSIPIAADALTEGTETLTLTLQGKTASILINDTSKTAAVPTYDLVASGSSVNEGSVATFNLTTTGVSPGTSISYTISGVSSADVTGGLSGTTTVDTYGLATISIPVTADFLTEGTETLTVTAQSKSASILINDTSKTAPVATYSLAAATSSVSEGSTAVFTLTTANVASGTSIAYSISGVTSSDITGGALSGTAIVNSSGIATISIPISADSTTEGNETLTVSAQGQIANITILDTSSGLDITPPALSSITPSDESLNVKTNSNIVLTFNEAIQRGIGSIYLKNSAGNIIETFSAATSSNLDFTSKTLTINPSIDLGIFSTYKVEIDLGAVTDVSGNKFAGLTDYNFKTETLDSLYQFFAVAFSAAPGVEYMNQLADAYNSGLSVKQIVNIFTTKSQFTSTYPTSLSSHELATDLVNNIVKTSATSSAKISAIADIEAALGIGMTIGDVVFTVFGNLANKPSSDPVWGGTAKQFSNQLSVAKYYTETLGKTTTELSTLKASISTVTLDTDVSSSTKLSSIIANSELLPPTYNLIAGSASANEGTTATFKLSTTNVTSGTFIPYSISGVSGLDVFGGSLTGTAVVNSGGVATISVQLLNDSITEGSETLTVTAGGATASTAVNDTSKAAPTYALAASGTSVNEGSTATFTLSTTSVASGTSVPYILSGISAADIAGGLLSGNAVVNSSGQATISVSLLNDLITEGSEVLIVSSAGSLASVIVNDTSTTPATYALTSSSTSVFEGTSATFTLTTTNVTAGTVIPYTLSGINASDVSGGLLTGNATITANGTATIVIPLLNDFLTEGDETLVITAAGQTASTLVIDTSKAIATYSLSTGAPSFNEGSLVTFNVSTTNVDPNTVLSYSLSGIGIDANDFVGGNLNGTVTIDSFGKGLISFYAKNDEATEGTETLTVTLQNQKAYTSILDTSITLIGIYDGGGGDGGGGGGAGGGD